eukprot:4744489-Pyramimonas_sp.AAC.1
MTSAEWLGQHLAQAAMSSSPRAMRQRHVTAGPGSLATPGRERGGSPGDADAEEGAASGGLMVAPRAPLEV